MRMLITMRAGLPHRAALVIASGVFFSSIGLSRPWTSLTITALLLAPDGCSRVEPSASAGPERRAQPPLVGLRQFPDGSNDLAVDLHAAVIVFLLKFLIVVACRSSIRRRRSARRESTKLVVATLGPVTRRPRVAVSPRFSSRSSPADNSSVRRRSLVSLSNSSPRRRRAPSPSRLRGQVDRPVDGSGAA